MSKKISVGVAVALAMALFSSALYLFPQRVSADHCPNSGERHATEADVALMKAAGFPAEYAQAGNCWKPNDSVVGQEKGEAKQYLNSIVKGGSCGPYRTTAEDLNPDFAVCAARFMKDLRAKDQRFYVVSMFRSSAHQAYLCGGGCPPTPRPCGAPGRSKHQSGNAVDIGNGQRIIPEWVHQMAQGYGIRFPVNGDSGHMEPIPGSDCSNPNFKPTDTVGPLTPTARIANAVRTYFNPPTQAPPPLPSTSGSSIQSSFGSVPVPTPSTPGSCIPQFFCAGSIYYYKTSSCADQVYQRCEYGCADSTTCAASPGSATSSTSTVQTLNTSTGTSTYDLIGSYATTSTTTQTLAPITLNPGTANATILQPQQTPSGVVYVPVNTVGGLPAQETFTSNDLSTSLPFAQPQTGYAAALNNLKAALLNFMNYLRPFGGAPSPVQFE